MVLVVFFFLASSCLFAGGFCMVLYNCEVQADVSRFIKLKFSKVFYKYCCFCLNVGVGTALLLWQLGDSDVPHLSGVLSVPQALKQLIPSALNILKSLQSSPQPFQQCGVILDRNIPACLQPWKPPPRGVEVRRDPSAEFTWTTQPLAANKHYFLC